MSIDASRREYEGPPLDVSDVAGDPVSFFSRWYSEAQVAIGKDVNAMCLATVDELGRPSQRFVLLRGFDEQGVRFFTDCSSTKGQHLAANPAAALAFYWPALDRQVRIEGTVAPLEREVVVNYFHSRPRTSQIAATASWQSSVLESRDDLQQRFKAAEQEVGDAPVTLPERWGGYLLTMTRIEFWQGQPSRLHDRVVCNRNGDTWVCKRLAP